MNPVLFVLFSFVLLLRASGAEASKKGCDEKWKQTKLELNSLKLFVVEMKELVLFQQKKIEALEKMCPHCPSTQSASAEEETSSRHGAENIRKRSDDSESWEPALSHMTQQMNQVTADVQALKNADTLRLHNTGSVYTRWGHASCPNSTELVYSGYFGGSYFSASGAAANSLCLPHNPVFDGHTVPSDGHADLYGGEYQTCTSEPECNMTPACAICRTPRLSVVMVPATNVCHPGWNLEYSGYLMAGHPTHHATEYICVDKQHGYMEGTQGNQEGKLLYYTTVHCASLSCPPYVDGRIVLCAVCSK